MKSKRIEGNKGSMSESNFTRRGFLVGGTAVVLGSSLLGFGCGSDSNSGSSGKKSGFVIGYANGYTGNTWRAQFIDNIQKRGEKYKEDGTLEKLILVNSPADINQQINQVNDLITQGVDALLIDPVSAPAVKPVVPRATSSDILTMISNDPAPTPEAKNVVGDNYTWWEIQTKWLAEALNGKGNIVMVTGVPGNTADVQRVDAAKKVLKNYPDIKVLTSVPGSWDQAKARQAMSNVLASNANIDGVLTQDGMAEGIMNAFEAANRKLPRVMTGDYTAGFLRRWKSLPDLESISVPYSPTYGADSIEFAVRLLQGEKLAKPKLAPNPLKESLVNTVLLPPSLVITRDGDNSAPWCSPSTECVNLDEAIKRVEGKPDSYMLEAGLSKKDVDSYFE